MAADLSVVGLVEEFVVGQHDAPAKDLATGVIDGKCTALEIVEALGASLTNSEPRTRGRGVHLLSQVLLLSYSTLGQKEVEVLVIFYVDRLKDHHLITPYVLQGLKALSMSSVMPEGLAVMVLKALFQELHVQSLLQSDRHSVYSIITNFMDNREQELKGLGADFTFGFIQAMDGEKDPRNLLMAFQISRDLIVNDYDLGSFVEELFEITSCYFPVDFTPPSTDPHGISQDDLVLSLRSVLTATPRFAEFLLPLLVEKLDSDVQNAKVDSLQTLMACCKDYRTKDLKEFLPALWHSIRREVFQTAVEKVETEGLAALQAIATSLSKSVIDSDAEDSLDTFLSNVLQDCEHHLCEPDMKLVWPSAKLLQAAASASYRAWCKITSCIFPLLLEQFNKHKQSSQRWTILGILKIFIKLADNWSRDEEDENSLCAFKDQLCGLVFSALTDSSAQLQTVGTSTLAVLGSQQGLLSPSDIELSVDHLNRLILQENDPQVCAAALEASASISAIHPSAFISKMVPALTRELSTEPMEMKDDVEQPALTRHVMHQRSVRALAAISTHPSVVQKTVPVLLKHLTDLQKESADSKGDVAILTCQSLQLVVEQCKDAGDSSQYFHQMVVPCLLGLAVQASIQASAVGCGSEVPLGVLCEEKVIAALGTVISTAYSHRQTELVSRTISQVVALFLDGNDSFLPENNLSGKFHPFHIPSPPWPQTQLITLLQAAVCSLPKNVVVPQQERLLAQLIELCCTSNHQFTYTSAAKCVAGLINKYPAGEQLDGVLRDVLKKMDNELQRNAGDCSQPSSRTRIFTLLLWLTKSLVLRYHPVAAALTDKLMALLTDPELGAEAADGFSLLVSDSTDVLNKATHADVRIMYRQRFFTENVSKLVQGFHAAGKDNKSNYLKALSHVLNSLPKQVLLTQLPSLLTLLLEALSCPDQVVQLSTLGCLHPLLLEAPHIMGLHIETLVSKMLHLTTSPAMKVRISSLQCMHALTKLPSHVILPHKARVIQALAKPLDDKKRLVRREAVVARGEWFLLGSPGR
ncbi:MMS19 nucleotide excision repair protein homolog isoform X2 [Leucoraja erinacea]|uniref:MMS19 nucleotide excision repair protein homolog isoform X2 n=1 Tax=Leucoraja erinaceus TaxID=7782 RepID=UPI0024559764|nr:MMS19 nucleotide excision repair protein homolog isoform X2 [Leucoraja erinacea]